MLVTYCTRIGYTLTSHRTDVHEQLCVVAILCMYLNWQREEGTLSAARKSVLHRKIPIPLLPVAIFELRGATCDLAPPQTPLQEGLQRSQISYLDLGTDGRDGREKRGGCGEEVKGRGKEGKRNGRRAFPTLRPMDCPGLPG